MNIENFADLLQAARTQALPQRLLLVFADVELPEDASPEQRAGFEAGQGGALVPVLCVDKGPEELTTFAALAQEATGLIPSWRFVLVAALSGTVRQAPEAPAVEAALERMVAAVRRGELSGYLVFDQQGLPIALDA